MSAPRKLSPIHEHNLYFALQERERNRIIAKWLKDVGVPDQMKDDVGLEISYRFAKTKCLPPGQKPKGQIISLANKVAFRWALRMKMELGFAVKLPDTEATAEKRRQEIIKKAEEQGRELLPSEIPVVTKYGTVYLDDPDDYTTVAGDVNGVVEDIEEFRPHDLPDFAEMSPLQLAMLAEAIDLLPAGLMRFGRHLLEGYSAEQAGDIEGLSEGTAVSYSERIREKVCEVLKDRAKEAGIL